MKMCSYQFLYLIDNSSQKMIKRYELTDNAISRVAFATENFSEGGSGRVSNNLFNAFFYDIFPQRLTS